MILNVTKALQLKYFTYNYYTVLCVYNSIEEQQLLSP